ncbi:MAG: hypothetical protein K2Q10_02975, partial [Rhodospirillales bacterium]|nr:hypothetical protein [Rhodospirillales bacterium]
MEAILAWTWLAALLFLGTFVQEDAAIFAGTYLVAERQLPLMVAVLSLYAGIITGDLAIYGLGALARRCPWLGRRLGPLAGGIWLERRLFLVIGSCRLMPTLLFPTFAACGWFGVPFGRFAAAVVLSASLYMPSVFLIMLYSGEALSRHIESWGWAMAAALLPVLWLIRRRVSPSAASERAAEAPLPASHPGMPPLPRDLVRVSPLERIPPPLFYVPLGVQWLWLAVRWRSLTLPTLANPAIEAGGLLGESKMACLTLVGPEARSWVAVSAALRHSGDVLETQRRALLTMGRAGLSFPVVAKPDIGWRGFGVRKLGGETDLLCYLGRFPAGEQIILQEYVDWHGEAGLFYIRPPGERRGWVYSMTLRYYPFVVGDGDGTVADLIRTDRRAAWKARLLLEANRVRLDEV